MQIPTGEDIRAMRNNKGLTQSELAESAGVSQPLIARIESDDVDPTIETLYSVISALNHSNSEVDKEDVKISMPSALKDARKRTGYTQSELADVAGVSQSLISRIERQDINSRSSTLRLLFSHLDPLTTSRDAETSTSSTTSHSILAEIEHEFETVQGPSNLSDSNETDHKNKKESCPNCDSDLSSYLNPNYCPDCGSNLFTVQ